MRLKKYAKNINGILSVGADKIGLKAWDGVGYYRNTNEFNLIFADGGSLLNKYLEV